jgi:hypothetical protein
MAKATTHKDSHVLTQALQFVWFEFSFWWGVKSNGIEAFSAEGRSTFWLERIPTNEATLE